MFLKQRTVNKYPAVNIGGNNKHVHRLIAITFHGSPPFEGEYACHKDGDRENNHKDNIYWGTAKQNQKDRRRHGTSISGEQVPWAKLTRECVKTIYLRILDGEVLSRLAEEFCVSLCAISDIKHKRSWQEVTDSLDTLIGKVRAAGRPVKVDLAEWKYASELGKESDSEPESTGTAPEGDDPASDQASDE
jgi:hypothetical protein